MRLHIMWGKSASTVQCRRSLHLHPQGDFITTFYHSLVQSFLMDIATPKYNGKFHELMIYPCFSKHVIDGRLRIPPFLRTPSLGRSPPMGSNSSRCPCGMPLAPQMVRDQDFEHSQ